MATPTAVVVGGSLAGLLNAITLLHLGFAVTILEQSPELKDAGAGIVLGGDLIEYLRSFDTNQTNLCLQSEARVYIDRKNREVGREDRPQLMSSWDALYWALRALFDGGQRDGSTKGGHTMAIYKVGCAVLDVQVDDVSEEATVSYLSGRGSATLQTLKCDIVVVAQGPASGLRSKYSPNTKRTYAGYVGFRGLAKEDDLPEAAKQRLFGYFTFFHSGQNDGTGNSQFLTYLIPGEEGNLNVGQRHLKWVWYENFRDEKVPRADARNTSEDEDLSTLLTDNKGKKHKWVVPAGSISDAARAVMDRKLSNLPPAMQAAVKATPNPFVTAISDTAPPMSTLVYERAHVLFVGDSVVSPRPHTAASTNQAAVHALSLYQALLSSPELDALREGDTAGCPRSRKDTFVALEKLLRERWEPRAASYAKVLFASGKEMGDRSQFGVHPFSVDKTGSPDLRHHERTLSGNLGSFVV
ncbi:hypothetical protein T439DRAFT_378958 [Meredithblackwellia eburnea MCA 4105]